MSDKAKTTWIIIVCVLAVALVAFLVWKMRKRDTTTEQTAEPATLEVGSRGDEVRALQSYLNSQLVKLSTGEIKYSPIAVDGIFGEETAMACNVVFGTEKVTSNMF